jgi:hypothetical protein
MKLDSSILRRWKSRVASDEEMRASVHKDALRLLSGIQLFVKAREKDLVQGIIMDAATIHVSSGKSTFVS